MKHTIKHKNYGVNGDQQLVDVDHWTRGKAIKAFCTECLGYETHPKECTNVCCALYPFRGKTLVAWKDGRPIKDEEKSEYAYGIKKVVNG